MYSYVHVASCSFPVAATHHQPIIESESRKETNLRRSASTLSLKHDTAAGEDKATILSQMFWIAVALLQSDFEYEFLLAVNLLTKVPNISTKPSKHAIDL